MTAVSVLFMRCTEIDGTDVITGECTLLGHRWMLMIDPSYSTVTAIAEIDIGKIRNVL